MLSDSSSRRGGGVHERSACLIVRGDQRPLAFKVLLRGGVDPQEKSECEESESYLLHVSKKCGGTLQVFSVGGHCFYPSQSRASFQA